ncbi:MAG: MurR/RpiR family transcriptional regulator [Lachnospiraceae bacterium]|nr:MurR/RpiR family transcriptional regulator [Lachnospiraceae bacterium]
MEQRNLLSELQFNREYYSNVEKKIASVIQDDPKRLITYSIAELSEVAGVSQGSINNFSRKLVGTGFAGLKLQLAQQLPKYSEKQFNLAEPGDEIRDILAKNRSEMATAFQNTIELNGEETLKRVVDLILRAKKIEIYGIYRSSIVAMDFYYQLLQLGLSAAFVSDVLMCSISAALLDQDDLVIAISSSGRTKDILDTVKVAKSNHVPVVCITSDPESPLVKLSDEALICVSSGNSISNRSDEVRLAQMFMADSLSSYIRYKIDETGEKRYFKMAEMLSAHSVYD